MTVKQLMSFENWPLPHVLLEFCARTCKAGTGTTCVACMPASASDCITSPLMHPIVQVTLVDHCHCVHVSQRVAAEQAGVHLVADAAVCV